MIEDNVIKAQAWDALMNYFKRNNVRVSMKRAAKIVGGLGRLQELIATDKITDYTKSEQAPNSPWQFSAAEIYSHVRTYNIK